MFPLEQAVVIEKGILFNGLIYTCSIAIREQWYLKDFRVIPIYFDYYDDDYILVLLKDGYLTIVYRVLCNINHRQTKCRELPRKSSTFKGTIKK